jgi:hypothetical protein
MKIETINIDSGEIVELQEQELYIIILISSHNDHKGIAGFFKDYQSLKKYLLSEEGISHYKSWINSGSLVEYTKKKMYWPISIINKINE